MVNKLSCIEIPAFFWNFFDQDGSDSLHLQFVTSRYPIRVHTSRYIIVGTCLYLVQVGSSLLVCLTSFGHAARSKLILIPLLPTR